MSSPRPAPVTAADASAEANRLAAEIERGLEEGRDILSEDAFHNLMAALCKSYTAQIENGHQILPVRERTGLNSTEVMTTASGLLKSANLAVFELGMWQSWTGR